MFSVALLMVWPPSAYNLRALSGEVDRAKPGTARAGQRQPVRDVDIRAGRRQVQRAVIAHPGQRAAGERKS